jgi:cell division protein FtsW (lipid II flippase)
LDSIQSTQIVSNESQQRQKIENVEFKLHTQLSVCVCVCVLFLMFFFPELVYRETWAVYIIMAKVLIFVFCSLFPLNRRGSSAPAIAETWLFTFR